MLAARLAAHRWARWAARCRRCSAQSSPHAAVHRLLQAALRSASMGLTFARAQCMPLPSSRAPTTSLFALSTPPLPIG